MNRKVLLSIGAFLVFALLLLVLHQCNRDPVLRAGIFPVQTSVGEPVVYRDSTQGAHQWKWEFGEGSQAMGKSGVFQYRQPGTYLIRLTIDGKQSKTYRIQVKSKPIGNLRDSVVRVFAPPTGYVGEKLVFVAQGAKPTRFAWRFGESGEIDSREQTAIYSYAQPGMYTVVLNTNITKYVLKHTVRILPGYKKFEPPLDSAAIVGNDIRRRLQAIANGISFNENYYYLLRRYLCRNHYAVIGINNAKVNDFYSYCMGLQFDKGILIDDVGIVQDTTSHCITKLMVTQHNK